MRTLISTDWSNTSRAEMGSMQTSGSTTGTVAVNPGTCYAWALYVRDAYRIDPRRTAHPHPLHWPVSEDSLRAPEDLENLENLDEIEDIESWIAEWDTWWRSICDFQAQCASLHDPGLDVPSRLRMLHEQTTSVPGGDRPDLMSLAPLPRMREAALPLVQPFADWWSSGASGVKRLIATALVTSVCPVELPEQGEVRVDVLPTDLAELLWIADDYAIVGITALKPLTPQA